MWLSVSRWVMIPICRMQMCETKRGKPRWPTNRLLELYMHFLYIKICHTFAIEICMDYFFLLASKYHYLSMGSSVIHSDWSYIHTTITCGLIWLETLLKEKKRNPKELSSADIDYEAQGKKYFILIYFDAYIISSMLMNFNFCFRVPDFIFKQFIASIQFSINWPAYSQWGVEYRWLLEIQ